MGQALNRIIKRTLQNEYRRQTQRRSGVVKAAVAAVVSGPSTLTLGGQATSAFAVDAPPGSLVAVQNIGRPANAVYAPARASAVFAVGGAGGGSGGGGGGGGPTYSAGAGIDITSTVISTKNKSAGGIASDSSGNFLILPINSGLILDGSGLKVDPGDGIDILSTGVSVDVTDLIDTTKGLGEDGANNIYVKLSSNPGLEFRSGGGLALALGDDLTYATTNATTATGHTHAVTSSADVSVTQIATLLRSGNSGELGLRQLTLRGNLIFQAGDRSITATNRLTIAPADDLQLWPTAGKLITVRNSQTTKTVNAQDNIGGISGFNIFDSQPPANYMQLTIANIKADNIFARKFTADEARVARGEWWLTRSFGVVETTYDALPAPGSQMDIWFEEAPQLGNFKLFDPGNWAMFRIIDIAHGTPAATIYVTIVDVPPNGYIAREAQTADGVVPPHMARQKWRLLVKAGGFTGQPIAKGEVLADIGLPANGTTDLIGQGSIYMNALHGKDEGSEGPFVNVQTFDHVTSNIPYFKSRVRIGNLHNVVDYTDDIFGFAAGNDLSSVPTAGFSGATVDTTVGMRLFNTDLALYDAAAKVVTLTRSEGLTLVQDQNMLDKAYAYLGWVDYFGVGNKLVSWLAAANGGTPGDSYLQLQATSFASGAEAGITIGANSPDAGARLSLNTSGINGDVFLVAGGNSAHMLLAATEIHMQKKVLIADLSVTPIAPLHVYEASNNINESAGILIDQGSNGDAVIHWRINPIDKYFTAGIDNSDGRKFKISAGTTLGGSSGLNDFITLDPTTGTVTIKGLTVGPSAPADLVAGSGIQLIGPTIQVDPSVVRTSRILTAGAGLTGGGTLATTVTFDIDLASPAGLTLAGNELALAESVAGVGLIMESKVLRVDPALFTRTSTQVIVHAPLDGGGPLSDDIDIYLQIATGSGLFVQSGINPGLRVDPSIAGTGLEMLVPGVLSIDPDYAGGGGSGTVGDLNVTAPITGGGPMSADVTVGLKLHTTSPGLQVDGTSGGLKVDSTIALNTLTVGAGNGLSGGGAISTNPVLNIGGGTAIDVFADNIDVKLAATSGLNKTSGLAIGGGTAIQVLASNIDVLLAANSGLVKGSGLAVDPLLAGNGLLLTAGKIDVVPADTTLTVAADNIKVNQAFDFNWTGAQTWAAGKTQTHNGPVIFNQDGTFNTGVFTFNTNPKIAANIDFINGPRQITTQGTDDLALVPGGSVTLSPNTNVVYPKTTFLTDIGAYNRKFRTLYIGELYAETLVAQKVMATVGGRVMIAPTNVLVAQILASATPTTTIHVKYNNFQNGSYIMFESAPGGAAQFEVMKVTSVAGGVVGDYTYTVTRDQDLTGANQWEIGDACVDWGFAAGQGYIDLTSTTTALNSKSGPTITVYSRTSTAAWNNIKPVTTMGNLKGFVGFGGDEFGFAAGNDLTINPLTTSGFSGFSIDKTNGLRLFNTDLNFFIGTTNSMLIDDSSGIKFLYQTLGSPTNNPLYQIEWDTSLTAPDLSNQSRLSAYRAGVDSFFRISQVTTAGASLLHLSSTGSNNGNGALALHNDYVTLQHTKLGALAQIILKDSRVWISDGGLSDPPPVATSSLHLYHNNAFTGSNAGITVEQLGGGDSQIQFLLTGVRRWTVGADNSDLQKFKIANNAALGSADVFTIDTAGFAGFGLSDPFTELEVLSPTSNLHRGISVTQVGLTTGGAPLTFFKARGTRAAKTVVVTGDNLGIVRGYGWDGLAWAEGARIAYVTNGTIGAGAMPTDMVFSTAGATGGIVEEMRLTAAGNLGIGTAGPSAPLHVMAADLTTRETLAKFMLNVNTSSNLFIYNATTAAGANMAAIGGVSSTTARSILGIDSYTTVDSSTQPMTRFNAVITDNLGDPANGVFSSVTVRPLFAWQNNGAARMTMLASGFVGIGQDATTPTNPLHVRTDQNTNTIIAVENQDPGTGAGVAFSATNGTSSMSMQKRGANYTAGALGANTGFLYNSGAGDIAIYNSVAAAGIRLHTANNATSRLYIDELGNMGVSTTDVEAWHTSFRAIEWYRNAIMVRNISPGGMYICDNLWYDGQWKYKTAAAAAYMSLTSGALTYGVNTGTPVQDGVTSFFTALSVDATGQVGVNVTPAAASLHIGPNSPTLATYSGAGIWLAPASANVTFAMRATGGIEGGMFLHSSNNMYLGTWTNHALILRSNNIDKIFINDAATYEIDIVGYTRVRSAITSKAASTSGSVQLNPGSSTVTGLISFYRPHADAAAATRSGYIGSHATNVGVTLENSADFYVSGGSMGLGVITPGIDYLGTNDYTYDTFLEIRGTNAALLINGNSASALDIINRTAGINNRRFNFYIDVDNTSRFQALNDVGTPKYNFLTLDHTNGVIGFNNANPLAQLDVIADARNALRATSYGSASGVTFAVYKANGSSGSPTAIANSDYLGGLQFRGYTSGGWATSSSAEISIYAAEAFDTGAGGKAGAQITFAVRKQLSATVTQRMAIQDSGNIAFSNQVYINTTGGTNRSLFVDNNGLIGGVASSIRYKTNIRPLPQHYDDAFIERLEPIVYNAKDDPTEADQVGLIAEAVAALGAKELVFYREDGEPESLHYERFIVPLIAALQRLMARVSVLEQRLAAT